MNILIAVTGLGVLCLAFEILNMRKAIVPFSLVGLIAILGYTAEQFGKVESHYNEMAITDPFSVGFSGLFILLTIFLIAMSEDFYSDVRTKISDFVSIKLFLLAGGIAMVNFGNLAMFFLGIEVLSIALYVLAASNRLDVKSNEAGMKYFLMGSFASGIILFGICLIYGATGSFNVAEIHELSRSGLIPDWFWIGLGMILVGMLFKVSAAPFHFWAPDVYEGSPTLTTATMSTLSKVVAMAATFKLLTGLSATISEQMQMIIAIVAAASMTIGNVMALRQMNVKRMLAFSGISHAGFMLMILLTVQPTGGLLLYYAAAYALAGIAAFAVIIYVCKNRGNEDVSNFNGLGKTSPAMAAILTGSLISMAGIPVFAGFFAKFILFSEAIEGGYLWLVIIAVINSIVSVGYYFRLILAMYTRESENEPVRVPMVYYAVGALSILINIAIGLFPSVVIELLA